MKNENFIFTVIARSVAPKRSRRLLQPLRLPAGRQGLRNDSTTTLTGMTIAAFLFVNGLTPFAFAADQWSAVNSAGETGGAISSSVMEDPTSLEDHLKQIINIEYKDAELSNVLRSLAWTYKLNIVTGPDIKGKVSINLQEITVEQALQAILTVNGLIYSKKGGVIYVSAGEADVVELKTDIISLKYLTAAQAQNLSRKGLSSKGDIKIDEVSNNMIITDYESNITKIKNLITEVDTAPQQVLIEAKIVDITSSDLRSLGLEWDADYRPKSGGIFGRGTRFQEILTAHMDLPTESELDSNQLTLDTLTLKNATFTGSLDALIKDGKALILASPSIAVINGQEARIVIGERFPYKERTQTTSGTTETTKFVDIGATLKVMAQINDDGYITLTVHPEISSLISSLDAGPRISTTEADTTVRVRQGETLVIAGLIRQTDNVGQEHVPFLGKIPILGYLFSRLSYEKEQRELAVFITPEILYSREELVTMGRKDELKNSYTLLDQTSITITSQKIYEQAVNMDEGKGLESVRKSEPFRKTTALGYYEVVFRSFPDSPVAPESMYRAALIHWKFFKQYKKAKGLLANLISDYPDSPFSEKARKSYKEIENQEIQKKKMK